MQSRVYFDHNATTPLSQEALAAVCAAMGDTFGNASSIHQYGQAAKQKLETARRQIAALVNTSAKNIVLLSGGTEANNLALFGCTRPGDHMITTAIEHPAVLNPCARLRQRGVEVTVVPPSSDGIVEPAKIRDAVTPQTRLISVMHANNETGAIQPIEDIASFAGETGILLHVDGVQALGKIDVDLSRLGAHLYSVSAHKLYAPKGIGALFVRHGTKIESQMLGGHHERDHRAGTENVPAAIAFGCASEWFTRNGPAERIRVAALRDRLEQGIINSVPDVRINGDTVNRLPNTTNLRFDGVEGEAMVIALDLRGFAVSSGSACSSGAVEPSHVLLAMGLSSQEARSSVRFSLGRANTIEQVDALIEAVQDAARHLRRVSAAYSHA